MLEKVLSVFLIIVFIPSFFGFAVYMCYLGSQDIIKFYTITCTDTHSIGSISQQDSTIEVEGNAVPNDEHGTVTGLFTETDCLAYTYSAQGALGSGPDDAPQSDDGRFDVLDEGSEYTKFYVEDETGQILVDPAGAKFEFTPEMYYNAPLSDTPEPVKEYMQRNPSTKPPDIVIHPIVSHILKNHNRFVERRLNIGDTVYITGEKQQPARWDTDEPVISDGSSESEFVIYDRPKRRTAYRYGIYGLGKIVAGSILAILMIILLYDNIQYLF
ncbi:hypothetical protein HTG_16265 [Natrinema mahii]|nr:hypothetical protein HTG_16265 [Natrinema mahii]